MVEIKREGDLATIVTGARIDTINAGEFEKEINPILAEQGVNIVLDCNSISSSGLRVVLKAQKMVSARKGDMTRTGVKPQIKKVFDMTGFSRFLKIQ